MELQETEKRMRSVNARFVAYLEKHRIYQLFHDIAVQLMIQKPDDHLVFMKQYVHLAMKRMDVPRIILIAPPTFDRVALSRVLQEELGIRPLALKDLEKDKVCHCVESEDVALAMRRILETGTLHECGWLLIDLPRSKKEARVFQRYGILPTHAIQLITSNDTDNWEWEHGCKDACCSKACNPISLPKKLEDARYSRKLRELREAYANCLIEVEVGIRTVDELGRDVAKLAKTRKHSRAPMASPSVFRIALIGSRGSGCNALAKSLAERFNLDHVDYDYIAEQARLQQNPLGEKLRAFEYRWGGRPKPEIRIEIVQKHILGYECSRNGWVLTGYPKSVDDFKLLDVSPAPPNRVIFLEVNGDVCRERLLNRRYNVVTGSEHTLSTKNYLDTANCKLAVHPNDYRLIVERDLQEYEENVADMLRYAGESAVKIDGNEDEKVVREKVEAYLMGPALKSQFRVPRPPAEIDPMEIEFEPDDEPDSSLFDDIRASEPTYTFV